MRKLTIHFMYRMVTTGDWLHSIDHWQIEVPGNESFEDATERTRREYAQKKGHLLENTRADYTAGWNHRGVYRRSNHAKTG